MANYRSKSSRKTRGVSRKRATRRATRGTRRATHSRHRRPLQSGG
jgi:hypothetical protein